MPQFSNPKLWVHLISLAGFLGTLQENLGAEVLYVAVNPADTYQWQGSASRIPYDINSDGQIDFSIWRGFGFGIIASDQLEIPGTIFSTVPPSRDSLVKSYEAGQLIGADFPRGFGSGIEWHDNNAFDGLTFHIMAGGVPSNINSYFGDFFIRSRYLGFRMELQPGEYHYGWLSVVNSTANPWILHLGSYAWETQPNVPILAGVIPEPTSITLLSMLFFFSVVRYRRTSLI